MSIGSSSWSEAQQRGHDRYFTGRPCKRGHIAERFSKCGKCSECHRVNQAEWRVKNPGKVKAYLSSWYERNKAHVAAYAKAWQSANPEYSKAKSSAWHASNREYVAEKAKLHLEQFPDKHRAIALRRRARVSAAGPSATESEIRGIFAAQRGRCAYCRTDLRKLPPADCHLDHIQAIAKGGTNARSNMQFCCKPCNLRKNKKDPVRFAREMGMLI